MDAGQKIPPDYKTGQAHISFGHTQPMNTQLLNLNILI